MKKTHEIVLITGGTKGIGRSLITKFSKKNFDIVTCSRNEEELLQLKKHIESKFGNKVYTFKVDVSDPKETFDFIEKVKKLNRAISVLINNAGIFIPGEIHREKEGILENMIQTNLYSAYHISRGFIPEMIKNKKGHIFTICSVASLMAYPNGGSYTISKFALYGLTQSLREELKPYNIRVTAVLPGATFTDSWKGSEVEPHRLMNAKDIAQMVWASYSLRSQAVVEDIVLRPQLGDL